MNSVGIYVFMRCLIFITIAVGITLCAIKFENARLMWFYLIPALLGGMEVHMKTGKADDEQSQDKDN